MEKRIEAGSGLRVAQSRRAGSLFDWLLDAAEPRIHTPGVDWFEVEYPARRIAFVGLDLSWIAWFFVFSMLGALLLKRRLGVAV